MVHTEDRRRTFRRSGDGVMASLAQRLVRLRAHLNEIRTVRFEPSCAACREVTGVLDRLADAETLSG